jgi:hypothetical protein
MRKTSHASREMKNNPTITVNAKKKFLETGCDYTRSSPGSKNKLFANIFFLIVILYYRKRKDKDTGNSYS